MPDSRTLVLKSTLDGISSMALAGVCVAGAGVSALLIGILQGAMSVGAAGQLTEGDELARVFFPTHEAAYEAHGHRTAGRARGVLHARRSFAVHSCRGFQPCPLAHLPNHADVRMVLTLFLLALLVLSAWFIAVVAFHITAAAIHLLLFVALVLFAVGFIGRRFARPQRRAV